MLSSFFFSVCWRASNDWIIFLCNVLIVYAILVRKKKEDIVRSVHAADLCKIIFIIFIYNVWFISSIFFIFMLWSLYCMFTLLFTESSIRDKIDTLHERIQILKDRRTCKVCMDGEINIVLLRCGHLVCCAECAAAVTKCPLCREVKWSLCPTYLGWGNK